MIGDVDVEERLTRLEEAVAENGRLIDNIEKVLRLQALPVQSFLPEPEGDR